MGAGVVPADCAAPFGIDRCDDRVPHCEGLVGAFGVVQMQRRHGVGAVGNRDRPVGSGDRPGVADLTAALGIEGGRVEHDAFGPDPQHCRRNIFQLVTADKVGAAARINDRYKVRHIGRNRLRFLVSPSALTLFGHRGIKAGHID